MEISSVSNIASHAAAPVEQAQPATQEQRNLIQAVKAVNAAELFGQDNELTFVLDHATRKAIVRIINRQTGEVVEQIPAEYVLRMAEENKGS